MSSTPSLSSYSSWKDLVAKYQKSHTAKSIWQVCNSFIPFFLIWYFMYLSLDLSYWLTIFLSLPAAGFLVRMFIIQHDCGHGSFFKSKRANDFLGMFTSIFTLTPYHYWRKSHAIHHSGMGNLEHRGIGDIYTMTVNEYLSKSKWGRFKYRLYRNPFVLFVFIPSILFIVLYRFPISQSSSLKKLQPGVYFTSLAIAAVSGLMIWLIGWQSFLLIQLPITVFASTTGTWLFYIQHQFEDTYWENENDWDFTIAALRGSSFYKLPKILQWFTGNIGFHHIHHLSPRIPNYSLPKCHKENPVFQKATALSIKTSLKSSVLSLWDESQKKLVGFKYLKNLQMNPNNIE